MWLQVERGGVGLAAWDYGGSGDPVLLLHGLAGHAREWDETASWLTRSHRVIAVEQRGHGRSQRSPSDMSRAAFVGDVVAWLDHLSFAQAHIVGQSLGGHTAFLVAARCPARTSRLLVAEASPSPDPEAVEVVRAWLDAWPTPFPTRAAAVAYFGGESLWADAWASGLERRDDGLHQAFSTERLLVALAETEARSYWPEWTQVKAPTLIVRAERGMSEELAARMADSIPAATVVTIPKSGHDLHLEQPLAWRGAVEAFLP
jgi:pimeloyl-ACP methyl ester carboxylesterase